MKLNRTVFYWSITLFKNIQNNIKWNNLVNDIEIYKSVRIGFVTLKLKVREFHCNKLQKFKIYR
jgi:hypothetical protein